jgi:SAM-dependent methyltransferase
MTAVRACPACGGSGRAWGVANGWSLVRCAGCATVFTADPPPGPGGDEYEELYDRSPPSPGVVVETLDRLVAAQEPARRKNRWLDLGCGGGDLMRAARGRGWEVEGSEMSSSAVRRLRAEGFRVWHGDVEREPGHFDVVSLIEVLEHVGDPGAVIDRAVELLRPGGRLYLTTPHVGGLSIRLLRTRSRVVTPPEHVQLFSRRGLLSLAAFRGLSGIELRTEGLDVGGLRAARSGRAPGSGGASPAQMSIDANAWLMSSRRGRIAKSALTAGLRATHLGDSLKLLATAPQVRISSVPNV